MSRVTRRLWGDVEPGVQRVFETFNKARGNVPNLFRVFSHRPELMMSFNRHFASVMGDGGVVPVRLKELVAVRVSTLNACRY